MSPELVGFAPTAPIAFMALHMRLHRRRVLKGKRGNAPQVFLFKLELVFNLAVLAGVTVIGQSYPFTREQWIGAYAFALIVFNGFAYSYFHWFNLSETGRRVRMMVECHEKGTLEPAALQGIYSPKEMIVERLKRLVDSNQIAQGKDGRYRLQSGLLLGVALALRFTSKRLGFLR